MGWGACLWGLLLASVALCALLAAVGALAAATPPRPREGWHLPHPRPSYYFPKGYHLGLMAARHLVML